MQFKDLLGSLLPQRTRRRRLSVTAAREALVAEEAMRLVDMDHVRELAIQRVEQTGIVFIDELDKVASSAQAARGGPDVSREGVQRDLLPIVEGSTVQTKHGPVRTDHILFIAAGAFHVAKPSDLIPELQGRFPIRVELSSLSEADFVRILTEPRNSLVRQYTELLRTEGVELEFKEDGVRGDRGVRREGERAHRRHRGAAALHGDGEAARGPLLRRARPRGRAPGGRRGLRARAARAAGAGRGPVALHPVGCTPEREWSMSEPQPIVLVVDDERFFREAICDALARGRLRAAARSRAPRTLKRPPRIRPSACWCSTSACPTRTGSPLLRRLREQRPALRVIVLATHAEQEDVLEALRLDASDYLAKPLHDEELVLAVRRALASVLAAGAPRGAARAPALRRGALGGAREAGGGNGRRPRPRGAARRGGRGRAGRGAGRVEDVADAGRRRGRGAARGRRPSAPACLPTGWTAFPSATGVAGEVVRDGSAARCSSDVDADARFAGRIRRPRYRSGSLAAVAVPGSDGALGVLCATDREGGAAFGEDELALMQILAHQLGPLLAEPPAPRETPRRRPRRRPRRIPGPSPISSSRARSATCSPSRSSRSGWWRRRCGRWRARCPPRRCRST